MASTHEEAPLPATEDNALATSLSVVKEAASDEALPPSAAAPLAPAVPTYAKNTVAELKALCRARLLPVSGSKQELVQRLTDSDKGVVAPSRKRKSGGGEEGDAGSASASGAASGTKRPRKMHDKTVLELLKSSGFTQSASKCTLAAISRRYVSFGGTAAELDTQAVFKGEPLVIKCCDCDEPLKPTLRQLLEQGDDGGDYEEGGEGASIQCPACGVGVYVPFLCAGSASGNCGRGFNHCTQCRGFGQCIGDYRNAHCSRCGDHYFQGLMGYSCPCTKRGGGMDMWGDAGTGDESDCECDGCLEGGECESLSNSMRVIGAALMGRGKKRGADDCSVM